MAHNATTFEHFEHLAIVLPLPHKAVAMPRYGTGTTYQASTLEALIAQIAPQIALSLWLIVEDCHVEAVRQLAPTARVHPVACILCVGACAHQPPTGDRRLRWGVDGAVEAAEIHTPRQGGTRWAYRALIRRSVEPGRVVLDLFQPTVEGSQIEHRQASNRREAKRLARAWFTEISNASPSSLQSAGA